jgi:hypothetical protein
MKSILLQAFLMLVLLVTITKAQNIGINTTGATPDANAMLDIVNTTKGLLIPRVSLLSTASISPFSSTPTTSMLVFNSNIVSDVRLGYYYWDGAKWVSLSGGSGGKDWSLLGNTGTTASTNFLGTTDAQDLVFKTNSVENMRILSNGDVGIGITTPTRNLQVYKDYNGGTKLGTTNINAGTGAFAQLSSDALSSTAYLYALGSGYTTSNQYIAASSVLEASGLGGLSVSSQANAPMRFYTNNGLERMRIEANGNTGIGSIAPNAKLDVVSTNTTNVITATSSSASTTSAFYANRGFLSSTSTVTSGYLGYHTSGDNTYGVYGTGGNYAGVFTNKTYIGNGNPSTSINISDLEVSNITAGVANPATINLRQSTSLTVAGNDMGYLNFSDNYLAAPQASIRASRDAASSSVADLPTRLTFHTIADGTATLTERLRIMENGNVGVNTILPLEKLHIVGTVQAGNATATNGSNILVDNYSNGHLTTLGTEYSSGGAVLGYGVYPSMSATGSFLSATPITLTRTAMSMGQDIRFFTGASQTIATNSPVATAEVMRITNAGNVGIGTAAPAYLLDVINAGVPSIRVGTTSLTGGNIILGNTNHGLTRGPSNAVLGFVPAINDVSLYTSNASLLLATGNAGSALPRIAITNAGDVGIGTLTPAARLDVADNGVVNATKSILAHLPEGNAIGSGTYLGIKAYDTQPASISSFAIEHNFYGVLNSAINFFRGGTNNDGFITFTTLNNTERMRITSAGNVGIGTNTPTATLMINGNNGNAVSGTPLFKAIDPTKNTMLYIDNSNVAASNNIRIGAYNITTGGATGNLELQAGSTPNQLVLNSTTGYVGINTSAPTANLSVNGSANNISGTWTIFSDARIKTVTNKFTDGLSVINKINPVKFTYNANAPFKSDAEQIGIVAQELELIAPYMVSQKEYNNIKDLREVNNQAYVFLLINAVKELNAKCEAQQQQINILLKQNTKK